MGDVWLLKPLTYVNRSGICVAAVVGEQGLQVADDLLIVVDDVALDPGQPRFRERGSAGNHKGLQSVEDALGTREYPRLRIGVGAVPEGIARADWVLSEFDDPDDEDAVLEALAGLAEGVEVWARHGIQQAMNRYNVRRAADD